MCRPLSSNCTMFIIHNVNLSILFGIDILTAGMLCQMMLQIVAETSVQTFVQVLVSLYHRTMMTALVL